MAIVMMQFAYCSDVCAYIDDNENEEEDREGL